MKFDRQILAIARVQDEDHIYTDDGNMRRFAEEAGFQVTALRDVPLPLSDRQIDLPLSVSGDTHPPESNSND